MILESLPSPPGWVERLRRCWHPTLRYWMETEVHVYGFSIAASALLSFFPFLIVMVSLCRYVLEWPAAEAAIYLALGDYFPDQLGDFIRRNLRETVNRRGPFQLVSVLLLLFTANGVFEPLEVALNRVWGVAKNRSYLKNQLVSLGLIFLCGALALLSFTLTALNQQLFPGNPRLASALGLLLFKMAAVPATILVLVLIYWLLPNHRIPILSIAPAAILVGTALEVLKYVNLLTWPWLRVKLQREYGPFVYSVSILLWSFLASMLVLAGGEWAARSAGSTKGPESCSPAGAQEHENPKIPGQQGLMPAGRHPEA